MLLLVCASKNSGVAATWISTIYFLSNWKNVWVKIGHTIESVPESLWKIILGKSLLYFKRSYTTSYKIRRSNLFDKQLLGNKREKAYQRFPTVRNHPKKAKLRLFQPARHMANLAYPDQHAIWRARSVPTSMPYGELGLSRQARHMASSGRPDQLTIWELGPSRPARHMATTTASY